MYIYLLVFHLQVAAIILWNGPMVRRGYKVTPEKNTVPPKEPIPIWNDITQVPVKLSLLPKIKFPIHSHFEYMLQIVFKITRVKLAIGRLLLIGIYWYHSTNRRFIHPHLFIHSHKGGVIVGQMVKPPSSECINKLENYI